MLTFAVLRAELLSCGFREFIVVETSCRKCGAWRSLIEVETDKVQCPGCRVLRPASLPGRLLTRGSVQADAKLVGWREQTISDCNYHLGRRSKLKRFERWDSPVCWLPADDEPAPPVRRKPERVNDYPEAGLLPDQIEERLKNRVRMA